MPSLPCLLSKTGILLLCFVAGANAQGVHTPPKDSLERAAIMDAIRIPCKKDLRQKVIFNVQKLRVTQGWAYVAVTPLTPAGAKIDYRETRFKAQVKSGDFDLTGEALLRSENDSWHIHKWRLGGTDLALLEWIDSEKAPASLDSGETPSGAGSPPAAETSGSLKTFLASTEGTYGWAPVAGGLSYDFFTDGRLHIQGSDGEATMWEGTWRLEGDHLTLVNKSQKTTRVVTAAKQNEDLILDGKKYHRYRP